MDNPISLRRPLPQECEDLTALLLRSKAHWGYDAEFMAACVDVLRITPDYLADCYVVVAVDLDDSALGICSICRDGDTSKLDLLYVDPSAIGRGVGAILFRDAVAFSRRNGARIMTFGADPHAEAFYRHMGAVTVSRVASEAIPGRMLPKMEYRL